MIEAILWDVDGTLAETERDGHRVAFNAAFQQANVPWRWDELRYGELLTVSGGRERLLYDMRSQEHAPSDRAERDLLAERLHRIKNDVYAEIVATGRLKLRDGVRPLMDQCERARVRMAIVTTTSRSNVDALLTSQIGGDWKRRFSAVVCAEEAPEKKPHPQAYVVALEALKLNPAAVLAIEDAPAGVSAARSAGVPVVVTYSHYFPAPAAPGALASGPSLGRVDGWTPVADLGATWIDLKQLNRWRSMAVR